MNEFSITPFRGPHLLLLLLRVPHTLLYCGKLREYVSNTCSEGICEDATNHTVHRRLP